MNTGQPVFSVKDNKIVPQNLPQRQLLIFKAIFFFFFCATMQHMEFLGQGSDQTHSCELHHSYGNTGSFNPLCWARDWTCGIGSGIYFLIFITQYLQDTQTKKIQQIPVLALSLYPQCLAHSRGSKTGVIEWLYWHLLHRQQVLGKCLQK